MPEAYLMRCVGMTLSTKALCYESMPLPYKSRDNNPCKRSWTRVPFVEKLVDEMTPLAAWSPTKLSSAMAKDNFSLEM
jgi:hypothetical protein